MRRLAIILVLALFAALLPQMASAITNSANVSLSVICYNTTVNLTTDKASYQYWKVVNMTVTLNNTENGDPLNAMLLIELYNNAGSLVFYMAVDNATAPANGVNTTSYYRNMSTTTPGNYTVRARIVPTFSYPANNWTITDCSAQTNRVQADKNISMTQPRPNGPNNLIDILNKAPGPSYEDVTLNWTLSNSTDVTNYFIYSTDSYAGGFNYNTPTAVVDGYTTNWTDTSADGVDQRYYVVRAFNGDLTDENTYAVGKFNLKLYTGWNLISLPLLTWNQSMNDVIYTATSNDKCERWAGDTQLFQRTNFFGLHRVWSGEFITIQPDRGYWYYSYKPGYDTVPYNNTIVGAVPTDTRYETVYHTGWTMLGWTSVNTTKLNSVLTNATSNDKIELYVAPTDLFQRTNFFGLHHVWSGEFSSLEPGRGYWYYSQNVTTYTWTYRP